MLSRTVGKPFYAVMNAQSHTKMTMDEFDDLFEELKNWDRWGRDDCLGTLNFITQDMVVAAAATVRVGLSVSLSLPVNTQTGPDNPHPATHYLAQNHDEDIGAGGLRFATDYLGIQFHGNCHSHMDAICHVSYNGKLYNGVPSTSVLTSGATIGTIDDYRNGIVGQRCTSRHAEAIWQ